MSKPFDYSKWDNIELSDDEDDVLLWQRVLIGPGGEETILTYEADLAVLRAAKAANATIATTRSQKSAMSPSMPETALASKGPRLAPTVVTNSIVTEADAT